ncbi:MAG: aspartate 1-decarboxylase [Candidatus Cloacimonadota bacterium]|nr:MAG: aspartate 1-decarboxylase [Candidatus Cloacimonadota bacterium]
MLIEVLKSKIHKATITEADLNYIGSIAIDEDLIEAANLIENEKVSIYNITNGERLDTYVIRGKRGTGTISLNGAAARKAAIGDKVIIVSYAAMDFEKAKTFKPTILFPNDNNNLK